MSARSKKKKSRKRRRAAVLDSDVAAQLRGMGFTQKEIEQAFTTSTLDADNEEEDQFASTLELLLAHKQQTLPTPPPAIDIDLTEPPSKKRRLADDPSSEEEKKSQKEATPPQKLNNVELKERDLAQKHTEMARQETMHRQYLTHQQSLEHTLRGVRDHIQTLYAKRPSLGLDLELETANDERKTSADTDTVKIESLQTQNAQLKGVICVLEDALCGHIAFCNAKVDEAVMNGEREEQRMRQLRHDLDVARNELASEKAALELMAADANSGTVMTLIEHNLFVLATLRNQRGADDAHFKALSAKVKAIQNSQNGNSNSNSNSNSKEERQIDGFECAICFSAFFSLSEVVIFGECAHFYCVSCMRGTVRAKLEDRAVLHIRCPSEKCTHELTHAEVRYVLDEADFKRFDEYVLEKTLQTTEDVRYCPGVDCGMAMFGDKESPMLTCPSCKKQFCFNCGTEEWHRGVTCDAFKRWKVENGKADVAFDEWRLSQGAKACPQCRSVIEKNGGCDHMTCQNCKHEFHWLSMEKWRGYGEAYNVPPNNDRVRVNRRGRGRGRARRRR